MGNRDQTEDTAADHLAEEEVDTTEVTDAVELEDLDVDEEAEDVAGGAPLDGKGNDTFLT